MGLLEYNDFGFDYTFPSLLLTYPNQPLNSERPREERNFQNISKNGAKREVPFGYGRVKWQESAILGMRTVLVYFNSDGERREHQY